MATTTDTALGNLVGQRIRNLRWERDLTQAELCERAGISIDAVTRIELGQRTPRLATLQALALALDVEMSDLVQGGDLPPPKLSAAVFRIVNMLEGQAEPTQKAAEKIVSAFLGAVNAATPGKKPRRTKGRRKKRQ